MLPSISIIPPFPLLHCFYQIAIYHLIDAYDIGFEICQRFQTYCFGLNFFLSDSEACFVGSHVEEGLVKVLRKPSLSAKRQSDNVTWDKVRISEEKCDK